MPLEAIKEIKENVNTSASESESVSETVRKMQLVELDIFKAFKAICERHNLRYFAIGGTCIGAIRHKGFIPWDDDMDVAMPYEDYQKFFEFAKTELPDYLVAKDLLAKSSRYFYGAFYRKIHNIKTAFIEEHNLNHKDDYGGIFIDVFPINGMPRGNVKRKLLIFIVRMLRKCDFVLRLGNNETIKKKIFLLFLKNLPFCYFSNIIKNIFIKYPFDLSDKIVFPWRPLPGDIQDKYYKGIFYYDDFKSALEVPFEDTTIRVPVGYDRYLTMDFGDYMQLPTEDERVSLHSQGAVIDFEKSYKYYQEAGII